MSSIVIVDHPMLAESVALFLQKHMSTQVNTTIGDPSALAPLNSLVLLELFLPERQHGILLARQLQHSRPDLTCIVWSRQPAPLYVWAGMEYKVHGFLDKAMPVSEILYWLDCAIKNRSAWPGCLLAQARQWDDEVALRVKALPSDLWLTWRQLVHGYSNAEIATHCGWSPRTIERRLEKLYEFLGVQRRPEAVGVAWEWGLVKEHATGPEWSFIVQELFPVSKATC